MGSSVNQSKNIWKKIKKEQLITGLLFGVLLLVIAIPTSSKEKEQETANVSESSALLEKQLEDALMQIEGIGTVDATIMLEPFVDDHSSPEIRGILVVATSGDNPVETLKIQETVMTLFQIDAHKIKVMKMK